MAWNYNISAVIEDKELFDIVLQQTLHNNGLTIDSEGCEIYKTSVANMFSIDIQDENIYGWHKNVDVKLTTLPQSWCDPTKNRPADDTAPTKLAICITDKNTNAQTPDIKKYMERLYRDIQYYIKGAKSGYTERDVNAKLICDDKNVSIIHIFVTGNNRLHPLVWVYQSEE